MCCRWAKGGVILDGARESVFETTADHSFFTEPVSCLVFNAVGSTNVSILVDVHCEYLSTMSIYGFILNCMCLPVLSSVNCANYVLFQYI